MHYTEACALWASDPRLTYKVIGIFNRPSDLIEMNPATREQHRTFHEAFILSGKCRYILMKRKGIYIVTDTWFYIHPKGSSQLAMAAWNAYLDKETALLVTAIRGVTQRKEIQ